MSSEQGLKSSSAGAVSEMAEIQIDEATRYRE